MNDSTIAFRAKEQLGKFLGKVFTHFSRPRQKFLADMLYGIQASGDTQLSSVMRAINDDSGKCHAVEKRLSRNVADATIGDDIDKAILEAGSKFVRDDTLILVDPTEIRKEFGLKMEHVTMIRDASRSSKEGRDVLVHGYHGCMAVACQNGKRKTVPLALRLWSSNAPGHKGENDEVLKIITGIMAATGGKGVLVYDRGGDRPAFYGAFIDNSWDFIVRMTGRSVLAWKGMHEIHWLASQCVMRHKHHVEFDSHGKECNIQIEFGAMPVRLPMLRGPRIAKPGVAVAERPFSRQIPLFDFNFRLRLNLHLTHAAIDAHPDLRFFRFEVAVAVPIPAEADLERVRGRERRGEGHRDLSPQVRRERHDNRAFAVDITAWARGG